MQARLQQRLHRPAFGRVSAPRAAVIGRASISEAQLVPVMQQGELSQYPDAAGVYAVYNDANELQYIGLSRKVSGRMPAAAGAPVACCAMLAGPARPAAGRPGPTSRRGTWWCRCLGHPQVSASVSSHMQELPDLTKAVRFELVPSATREALTDAWKAWVQEASERPAGSQAGAGVALCRLLRCSQLHAAVAAAAAAAIVLLRDKNDPGLLWCPLACSC